MVAILTEVETQVEGIGPFYGGLLRRLGISTLEELRQMSVPIVFDAFRDILGPPSVGRPYSQNLLAKWRAMARLLLIGGIDKQIAEVLVKKLRIMNIATLRRIAPSAVLQAISNAKSDRYLIPKTYTRVITTADVIAWQQFKGIPAPTRLTCADAYGYEDDGITLSATLEALDPDPEAVPFGHIEFRFEERGVGFGVTNADGWASTHLPPFFHGPPPIRYDVAFGGDSDYMGCVSNTALAHLYTKTLGRGTVHLEGSSDSSGVTIAVDPPFPPLTASKATSGVSGHYSLNPVPARAPLTLRCTKHGYGDVRHIEPSLIPPVGGEDNISVVSMIPLNYLDFPKMAARGVVRVSDAKDCSGITVTVEDDFPHVLPQGSDALKATSESGGYFRFDKLPSDRVLHLKYQKIGYDSVTINVNRLDTLPSASINSSEDGVTVGGPRYAILPQVTIQRHISVHLT